MKEQLVTLISRFLRDEVAFTSTPMEDRHQPTNSPQHPPLVWGFTVEPPPDPTLGHFATNAALKAAPVLKKAPMDIAAGLAAALREHANLIADAQAVAPGFVNVRIADRALQEQLIAIKKSGARWGKPAVTPRKTVVIDYSHPNIAKPMSVAHLRSTIIGAALYNVLKFSGFTTIGDNHLGDWGKQFGILIAAYHEQKPVGTLTISQLMALYVDYSARMKTDSRLEDVARAETKKLQDGDRAAVALWKRFYKISLAEFSKVYKLLGVRFDYYLGESSYKKQLPGIVADALARGIAERSEGAVIIPIEGRAPFVIQKSDEAFLYSTTDIAAVMERVKRFNADRMLYVVDNGQSLHFEQLFAAVKKLGIVSDEELVHVKFGLILGADMKKLSTRAGKHIALDAVIDEVIERSGAVVEKKRPDLSKGERAKIAKAVGIAALKYNDLSQNRQSDIAFDWDKMLNFEGNSAPYLMYTYARLRSILRKAKPGTLDARAFERADLDLVFTLSRLPDVVARVAQDYFPNHLADYLYQLASQVNAFYHSQPVLKAEGALRNARLHLIAVVAQTLKTGLGLLGIETLEKM